VTAYQCSRSTSTDSAALGVGLYEFSTPSDATDWSHVYISEIVSQYASSQTAFAQIPGAVALDSTAEVKGSGYAHAIIAVAGNIVMAVSCANDRAGPMPVDYSVWAEHEYAQL
jgi:hypothetical protein